VYTSSEAFRGRGNALTLGAMDVKSSIVVAKRCWLRLEDAREFSLSLVSEV
jgi:hypothetical protein